MAGTQVPVEEPSTASETEVSVLTDHVCFAAMTGSHRVQMPSRFVLQKIAFETLNLQARLC
jgi:hypothetical protein